jgi:hypothetical protein
MKRYVRFDVDLLDFAFRGRGVADPDTADPEGFVRLEQVEFGSEEDAEQWRQFDEVCGGDGTEAVIVNLDELEFLEGVVPGPNQPALFEGVA